MLLVYRRSTGEVLDNTGTNSLLPLGPEGEAAFANVPPGLDRADVGLLRLHDVEDAGTVAAVLAHRVTVVGGEVVLGDPLTPPASPASGQDLAARLARTEAVLDLLLLGGLADGGGSLDDAIGDDLPDTGGTLDDLEGLDLSDLPDTGETLDDLTDLDTTLGA